MLREEEVEERPQERFALFRLRRRRVVITVAGRGARVTGRGLYQKEECEAERGPTPSSAREAFV